MDSITQEVLKQSGDGSPFFWIMVGVVLVIQIADKLIYWIALYKKKREGGESHPECGELATQVQLLTKQVSTLVSDKQMQAVQKERSREQIESVYKWLLPDSNGEQKWKGASLARRVANIEGILKSLINDCNASFRDILNKLSRS